MPDNLSLMVGQWLAQQTGGPGPAPRPRAPRTRRDPLIAPAANNAPLDPRLMEYLDPSTPPPAPDQRPVIQRLAARVLAGQQPGATAAERLAGERARPGFDRLLRMQNRQAVSEILPQTARGLAEVGYRVAKGTAPLAGYMISPRHGEAVSARLTDQQQGMREFYGEPTTGPGHLARMGGDIAGTTALLGLAGAAGGGALVPETAPAVVQAGAKAIGSAPMSFAMGAGTDPDQSLLGMISPRAAESPFLRGATEAIPGLLPLLSPTIRQGISGPTHAMSTRWVPSTAEEFDRALQAFGKRQPDERGFITWRSPDEMRSEGMRTFLNPRGEAGFAVAPDTDIRNVFASRGMTPGGTGSSAMIKAVGEGGRKLDVFDVAPTHAGANRPSQVYHNLGFQNVGEALPWNDEYRPQFWNEQKYGTPDVLNMTLPEASVASPRGMWENAAERRLLFEGRQTPAMPPTLAERGRRGLDYLRAVPKALSGEASSTAFMGVPVPSPEAVAAERAARRMRPFLHPEEAAWAGERRSNAASIVDAMKVLPETNDLVTVALAGKPKRGWYRSAVEALRSTFGEDSPRFAALLAATSPQTSVESNLNTALRTWKNWLAAGRPGTRDEIINVLKQSVPIGDATRMPSDVVEKILTRAQEMGHGPGPGGTLAEMRAAATALPTEVRQEISALDAWRNNTVRALSASAPERLSGPKVHAFWSNLVGDMDRATLDTWMAKLARQPQAAYKGRALGPDVVGEVTGQSGRYTAYAARLRQAAQRLTQLTGETWTPAEVQETTWSWAKALEDRAGFDVNKVTPQMIGETPDFATLLHAPGNQGLLTGAGYQLPTVTFQPQTAPAMSDLALERLQRMRNNVMKAPR